MFAYCGVLEHDKCPRKFVCFCWFSRCPIDSPSDCVIKATNGVPMWRLEWKHLINGPLITNESCPMTDIRRPVQSLVVHFVEMAEWGLQVPPVGLAWIKFFKKFSDCFVCSCRTLWTWTCPTRKRCRLRSSTYRGSAWCRRELKRSGCRCRAPAWPLLRLMSRSASTSPCPRRRATSRRSSSAGAKFVWKVSSFHYEMHLLSWAENVSST